MVLVSLQPHRFVLHISNSVYRKLKSMSDITSKPNFIKIRLALLVLRPED
jgi:hypothetical protein